MSVEVIDPPKRDADVGGARSRRALFVAYAFPPAGGVSVHRVTKFIKYLPEFGWNCSVLTAENPSVPMFDNSLIAEVPPSTNVRRARTLEPGYALKSIVSASQETKTVSATGKLKNGLRNVARRLFNTVLQPDPQILWRPQALRDGMKLLKETRHDVIVATGPPFSSFLLALTLSQRTGLPLAVDYRDEWTVMAHWENKHSGPLDVFIQDRMQKRVLAGSSLILGTTKATAAELRRLAAGANSHAKVDHIYNGFDQSDFPLTDSRSARVDYGNGTDQFRLSFVGTLWNAASIGPVVDAIIALSERSPALTKALELVVAGRRTSEQEAELDRLAATPAKLVRLPFISHKEAIHLMCASDALLLINADLPNTERLVNAKTFEYMAARRPIFGVAPEGEIWSLLREMPGTLLSRPSDGAAIAANLKASIESWQRGVTYAASDWNLTAFERRNLAAKLASLLDELAVVRAE